MEREGFEISIAEPLRDVEGSLRVLPRLARVAPSIRGQCLPSGEVAVLSALGLISSKALGTPEPAGGD